MHSFVNLFSNFRVILVSFWCHFGTLGGSFGVCWRLFATLGLPRAPLKGPSRKSDENVGSFTALWAKANFETEVKRITNGAGVNVVYDSVRKTAFDKSIECLQRFGYMVLYGNASGPVTQFNPATLGPKGSLLTE